MTPTPPSDAVERVARALCIVTGADPDAIGVDGNPRWIGWKQYAVPALASMLDTTERGADGEAMVCEGCGSTKTIAAILREHGPQSIACCPERKMVEARHFWRASMPDTSRQAVGQLAAIGREHLQAGNVDDALTAFNRISILTQTKKD